MKQTGIILFLTFFSLMSHSTRVCAAASASSADTEEISSRGIYHVGITEPRKLSLLIGKSSDSEQEKLTTTIRGIPKTKRSNFIEQISTLVTPWTDYRDRVSIALALGEIPEDDRILLVSQVKRVLRSNTSAYDIIQMMKILHATTADSVCSIVDEVTKLFFPGKVSLASFIKAVDTYANTRAAHRPVLTDLTMLMAYDFYSNDERLNVLNIIGCAPEDKQKELQETLLKLRTPYMTYDNLLEITGILCLMSSKKKSEIRQHIPKLFIPGSFDYKNLCCLLRSVSKRSSKDVKKIALSAMAMKGLGTDENIKLATTISTIPEESTSDVIYWTSKLCRGTVSFEYKKLFLGRISEIVAAGLTDLIPKIVFRINAEIDTGLTSLSGWEGTRRINQIFEERTDGPIPFIPGITESQEEAIVKSENEQRKSHNWDRRRLIIMWRASKA